MRCHICPRKVGRADVPKGQFPVCRRCFGKQVEIFVAGRSKPQVFMVRSLSGRKMYRVIWDKLVTSCTCVDHELHAKSLHRRCKHERLVRFLAKAAGGMRQLVTNQWYRYRLD